MNGGITSGSFIILILGEFLLVPIHAGQFESELVSFEPLGEKDSILTAIGKITRISRGVFGLTANLTVSQDAGNEVIAKVNIYRSPLATNQYTLLPIGAARGFVPLDIFMTEFYKPFVMESLKGCSSLPQFKGTFQLPLKEGVYTVNNCQAHDDDIPDYIQPGNYKLELLFKTEDNPTKPYSIILVIKIMKKVA